ncbi:MAG: sugar transferase [Bacteroidetes bacterium]|nr:MAG: sugar transferase [Bacteroidota bacterium]
MYSYFKRLCDIVFSGALLLILSPLLIPVILLLKFTAEGEVFYFQKRIGEHNDYFNIWKFATMLKDSAKMGTGTITLRDDPRVTPVGKYLRKSKINELPQIINVLKGDMSFVGPRPLDDKAFNAYPERIRNKVYLSKPGITGIGSIVFRDEERIISAADLPPREFYTKHIAPYKGALELWYLDNKSFLTDLKILFLTVWVVIFPESELMYRVFQDIPGKPEALNLEG